MTKQERKTLRELGRTLQAQREYLKQMRQDLPFYKPDDQLLENTVKEMGEMADALRRLVRGDHAR